MLITDKGEGMFVSKITPITNFKRQSEVNQKQATKTTQMSFNAKKFKNHFGPDHIVSDWYAEMLEGGLADWTRTIAKDLQLFEEILRIKNFSKSKINRWVDRRRSVGIDIVHELRLGRKGENLGKMDFDEPKGHYATKLEYNLDTIDPDSMETRAPQDTIDTSDLSTGW